MAYLIELPFYTIYKKIRNSNSIDKKITLFKKWLEGYVKFNLAFHVAWILNQKSNDVPLNVRVLLVQFFQKPPSLGFCLSISKVINGIMKLEVQNDPIYESIVYFFDNKLTILNRLIELRNSDAHTSELLDEKKMLEIEGIISELIFNPIFKELTLVSSSYNEAFNSKCRFSKEIKDLDIDLLFLIKSPLGGLEKIILSQKDLCLFPIIMVKSGIELKLCNDINFKTNTENFTVNSLPNESLGELFFWNKRSGENGLYSCYLNEVVQEIKLNNITEISGFPYEDWKKNANPLYIKYLQCRKNITDDFFHDKSIDVKTWHEEFLLATRLETELNLLLSEKISCTEYIKGISGKIEFIQNNEEKVFYYKQMIDSYKKYQINIYDDKLFILNNIFFAIVYLFKYYFKKRNLELINNYFYQSLELISEISNFERDPNWYLLKLYENSLMNKYRLMHIPPWNLIFVIPEIILSNFKYEASRAPLVYKQVLSRFDVARSIFDLARTNPPNFSDAYLSKVMILFDRSETNEKILGPKFQIVNNFLFTLFFFNLYCASLDKFVSKSSPELNFYTTFISKHFGFELMRSLVQRFAQAIYLSKLTSEQFTISEAKGFLYANNKINENVIEIKRNAWEQIEATTELSFANSKDVFICHMLNFICIQENVCKLFLWGKDDFKQYISLDDKMFFFDGSDKRINDDKILHNRVIGLFLVLQGNIDAAINLFKENLLIGEANMSKFIDSHNLSELYGLNKQYDLHYREQIFLLDLVELLSEEQRNYNYVLKECKLSELYLQKKLSFIKEFCEKGKRNFGDLWTGNSGKLMFLSKSIEKRYSNV